MFALKLISPWLSSLFAAPKAKGSYPHLHPMERRAQRNKYVYSPKTGLSQRVGV